MFFTASIFFVTSYLSFLITLITVTPGGRDNHGCSQKLSQAFIVHRDAEKSPCPNPESPESVQDSSDAAMGLERAQAIKAPMGQSNQRF